MIIGKSTPVKEMIEEIAEFAERFPDQCDADVIEFAEFLHDIKIPPNSGLAHILHIAYCNGESAALDFAKFLSAI